MRDTGKLWHEKSEFGAAGRFSDRLLRRSGPFILTPPNLVTLAGALLAVPMCMAFLAGAHWLGLALFAAGLWTDWIDGALARYQTRYLPDLVASDVKRGRSEWIRLGPTELGKKIDPVVDKLRYFGALWPLGWDVLPHALLWASLGFALTLTAFRPLVSWRWGLKPGANAVGKMKVYAEAAAVLSLTALAAGAPIGWLALALCVLATALGAASLVTQGQSIRRQLKSRNP